MSEKHEITATERLLETIRRDQSPGVTPRPVLSDGASVVAAPDPADSTSAKAAPRHWGAGSRQRMVGVELGETALGIVVLRGAGSGPGQLLDARHIPLPADMTRGQEGFAAFLASALHATVGPPRGCRVWCLVPGELLDIWHITIPRLKPRQVAEAVYWRVQKEKHFDPKTSILDFRVTGEVMEKGVAKLAVTACLAPRLAVEELRELFARAGYTLRGATGASLAMQNLFWSGMVGMGRAVWADIHMELDFSRIEIFQGPDLVFCRAVKTGQASMLESLAAEYRPEPGAPTPAVAPAAETQAAAGVAELDFDDLGSGIDGPADPEPARAEKSALGPEQAEGLLWRALAGQDLPAGAPGAELPPTRAFHLILPAVERLVRQIERTFEYFHSLQPDSRVELLAFSGEPAVSGTLRAYVGAQLGLEARLLDPLGPESLPQGSRTPPPDPRERQTLLPALTAALSDERRTPNLLHTFRDRERTARTSRAVTLVYIVGILLAVALVTYGWVLERQKDSLAAELDQLRQEEAELGRQDPGPELLQLAGLLRQERQSLAEYARRYEVLATLGEASSLVPDAIKLRTMNLELGPPQAPESADKAADRATRPPAKAKDPAAPKLMILEGVVRGDPRSFDAVLASYLVKLELSPLFDAPKIQTRELLVAGPDGKEYPSTSEAAVSGLGSLDGQAIVNPADVTGLRFVVSLNLS